MRHGTGLAILCALLGLCVTAAAGPAPAWAAAEGMTQFRALAADRAGRLFCVGGQQVDYADGRSADFGAVKAYDPAGKPLWSALVRHGAGASSFSAAACDGAGSVYAAGTMWQYEADFGNGLRFSETRPSYREASAQRILVVKYDARGKALWFQTGPVRERTSLEAIAVDREGGTYAIGEVGEDLEESNAAIGFGTPAPDFRLFPNAAEISGGMLFKLSPAGKALWTLALPYATFKALALDESGAVYVAGQLAADEEVDFGSGVVLRSGNADSPFVMKLSPEGKVLWTRQGAIAAPGGGRIDSLALDAAGNLYAAGWVTGSCDFGGGVQVAGAARRSPMLVKLAPAGTAQWVRTATSDYRDQADISVALHDSMAFMLVAAAGADVDSCRGYADGIGFQGRSGLIAYDLAGSPVWASDCPVPRSYFYPATRLVDGSLYVFCVGDFRALPDLGTASPLAPGKGYVAKYELPAPGGATCVDSRVRVRKAGNLEAETLGYLEKGDRLVVLERGASKVAVGDMLDYWYRVRRTRDGLTGWCYGYFLKLD